MADEAGFSRIDKFLNIGIMIHRIKGRKLKIV